MHRLPHMRHLDIGGVPEAMIAIPRSGMDEETHRALFDFLSQRDIEALVLAKPENVELVELDLDNLPFGERIPAEDLQELISDYAYDPTYASRVWGALMRMNKRISEMKSMLERFQEEDGLSVGEVRERYSAIYARRTYPESNLFSRFGAWCSSDRFEYEQPFIFRSEKSPDNQETEYPTLTDKNLEIDMNVLYTILARGDMTTEASVAHKTEQVVWRSVNWYADYALSDRPPEELMAE